MKLAKVFLLGVIIFSSGILQAQKVGIRAGLNIANVSGSDVTDNKSLLGVHFGVFKEITIVPEILFLQPELQYSMQGYKLGDEEYSLGYLNIPVLAKVYVAKVLSFEAGPQVGFKVNDNFDRELGEKIRNFESSLVAGIGYNFPLGLSVNARYGMGLTEIVEESNFKNSVFQLGAAFKF